MAICGLRLAMTSDCLRMRHPTPPIVRIPAKRVTLAGLASAKLRPLKGVPTEQGEPRSRRRACRKQERWRYCMSYCVVLKRVLWEGEELPTHSPRKEGWWGVGLAYLMDLVNHRAEAVQHPSAVGFGRS